MFSSNQQHCEIIKLKILSSFVILKLLWSLLVPGFLDRKSIQIIALEMGEKKKKKDVLSSW